MILNIISINNLFFIFLINYICNAHSAIIGERSFEARYIQKCTEPCAFNAIQEVSFSLAFLFSFLRNPCSSNMLL